jgi:hypothetical protein
MSRKDGKDDGGGPSPADLDAVLKFLPMLERPDVQLGEWHTPPGGMPDFVLSDDAAAFVKALYDHGMIVTFDWPSWLDEALRYHSSPEALATADLGVVRKLLTTHVRQERFSAGHLEAVHASGHLVSLLRRLQGIRAARSVSSGE